MILLVMVIVMINTISVMIFFFIVITTLSRCSRLGFGVNAPEAEGGFGRLLLLLSCAEAQGSE